MATVSDHELIRNTIALGCVAFDSKEWTLLDQCFTEDCEVAYPEPLGTTNGIEAYSARLQKAIGHLNTQHSLTTQIINLHDADTASAMTYTRAVHFLDDKSFFAEGKFDDKLVKRVVDEKVVWLVKERKVAVMGVPRGDWSLLR